MLGKIIPCDSDEALQQIVQRSFGCSGSVQGFGWAFEKHGLVEDISACGTGFKLDDL